MGNPSITPQQWDQPPADQSHRIGCLGLVGGEYWSRGHEGLPAPGPDVASPQSAEIDVPGVGRVRIRYRAKHFKRGKSSHWAWQAEWGDLVDDQRGQDSSRA